MIGCLNFVNFLALKDLPDQSISKEVEFNSNFQAIQTANDILSDSQWRLKYDTDRLYTGYGKLHGPPKFNSPKALTKYYPASSSAKP